MAEEVPYSVIQTLGDIEIRSYPSIILATVRGRGDTGAFGLLFRYITGSNRSGQKIPMTAPVVSAEGAADAIPMTAPVVSDEEQFSFVLPPSYTMQTVPMPLDERVQLVPVAARKVAAIRFRGRATARLVRNRREAFLRTLQQAGIRPVGSAFLMRYDPPYTPGFLRRNEIGVEIGA